jgi:DNA replication and repair protein RecF
VVYKTHILRLRLAGYRNFSSVQLDFGDNKIIALCGQNGVGKTNILESLSLIASSRGLKKAPVSEINLGFGISILLEDEQKIICREEAGKKCFTLNDGKTKSADIAEIYRCLYLTPLDDTSLLSASNRRDFFDEIVSSFSSTYRSFLIRYQKARREWQRVASTSANPIWLTSLEAKMASYSVIIASIRLEIIKEIRKAGDILPESFPMLVVEINGYMEDLLNGGTALEAEKKFCEDAVAYRSSKKLDIGTHRTDFAVIFEPKNTSSERCSTGEQKIMLITIILMSAIALGRYSGTYPILLLDEVLSHLDNSRQDELFKVLSTYGIQTFLSGTDKTAFERLSGCQIIEV